MLSWIDEDDLRWTSVPLPEILRRPAPVGSGSGDAQHPDPRIAQFDADVRMARQIDADLNRRRSERSHSSRRGMPLTHSEALIDTEEILERERLARHIAITLSQTPSVRPSSVRPPSVRPPSVQPPSVPAASVPAASVPAASSSRSRRESPVANSHRRGQSAPVMASDIESLMRTEQQAWTRNSRSRSRSHSLGMSIPTPPLPTRHSRQIALDEELARQIQDGLQISRMLCPPLPA